MKKLTNSELLDAAGPLYSLDKQRRYVLQTEVLPRRPCPACFHQSNVLEAAGVELDAYDFGSTELEYRCPNCKRALRNDLLFLSGAFVWSLVEPVKETM